MLENKNMEDVSMLLHSHAITTSEVPGELALALNISGCPFSCTDCHTPELQNNVGLALTEELFLELLDENKGISVVCFMGGDTHKEELVGLLSLAKSNGLKTCLYTGAQYVHPTVLKLLDFLKVGKYISELGGLGSISTNQRFYYLKTGELWNYKFKRRII